MPLEKSSGNRRRLGHITKQGNSMLRFLLVEAAQVTARSIPEWRSRYFHLRMRRGRKIAKVSAKWMTQDQQLAGPITNRFCERCQTANRQPDETDESQSEAPKTKPRLVGRGSELRLQQLLLRRDGS